MKTVDGEIVRLNGEEYYKISNVDFLQPFTINVVSESDIVLFASSRGGLTAGRKNSENSIFPYETDDKLHQQAHTGAKTLIRTNGNCWQPLEKSGLPAAACTRNIYKNLLGNSLIYEETNPDIGLAFRYEWMFSEQYGIIRRAELENTGAEECRAEVLDGVENILPSGVDGVMQERLSCLVDGYKCAELMPENPLAVYSLTTKINDSPNPIEMLTANVAWTTERDANKILLSSRQVENFYHGLDIQHEAASNGVKTAFFINKEVTIAAGEKAAWAIVLDVNYDHAKITKLNRLLCGGNYSFLWDSVGQSTFNLKRIVGCCDGLQATGDKCAQSHHYLNTLYNSMRGGVFTEGYKFDYNHFLENLSHRNKIIAKQPALTKPLMECGTIQQAKQAAKHNSELYRLVMEYLPLAFSRRHGDPSRPWNKFEICLKDGDGNSVFRYEGNWRDIFQNWEALGLSFPGYFENFAAKFLNASTADGFNPYRINEKGIDWERLDEDNPFGGFGYWGDHQIVYLAKLLKQLEAHYPGWLVQNIGMQAFVYANLPYELLPYEQILQDNKNTIYYNHQKEKEILDAAERIGSDGKLVMKDGCVYHVSLLEKLLVPVLTKLSNLMPMGGVWMNTQRPEWNDANNAIVGIGLSVVTAIQLYEYLVFLKNILQHSETTVELSLEVAAWAAEITEIYISLPYDTEAQKKQFFDALGHAFGSYRKKIYTEGFTCKVNADASVLLDIINASLPVLRKTISRTQQSGLYTSYNLFQPDFSASPMQDMLEGQSAIIGSGSLSSEETINLISRMYKSDIYSAQQKNFYLYPVKKVVPFMQRNHIEDDRLRPANRLVIKDEDGCLRFGPEMVTKAALAKALEKTDISETEKLGLLHCYENTFKHNKFIGRSQVMYKYEGIGCIYWHQNAKLALAVQDMAVAEYLEKGGTKQAETLLGLYRKIVSGMIYKKSAGEVGAFPLEPYSHTTYSGKAEQPGMTGQVKESVISRRRELGVIVKNGEISFHPFFVSSSEFTTEESVFSIFTQTSEEQQIQLGKNSLGFTICRVPVIYTKSGSISYIRVFYKDGRELRLNTLCLTQEISRDVFENSVISRIEVVFQTE